MFSKITSLFERPRVENKKVVKDVQVGHLFRHVGPGNIIETAYVLHVANDSLGIPHVHYAVVVEQTPDIGFQEERTLGLESFSDRYSEVASA